MKKYEKERAMNTHWDRRDGKRRKRMPVHGRSVFTIEQEMGKRAEEAKKRAESR